MSKDTLPRLMLTVPEVAASTGLGETAVKDLIRDGTLPSVQVGRSRRVRISDLERYVAGLEPTLPEPDSRVLAAVEGRRRQRQTLRPSAAAA